MNGWRIAWASSVLLLIAGLLVPGNYSFIVVIVSAFLLLLCDRKLQLIKKRMQLDVYRNKYLQTIIHQRHDWMNELQILFGYIRLKKYDQLVSYVEKIKEKAALESRITRIGSPELALFLLSFQTQHSSLKMELTIEDGWSLADLAELSEQVGSFVAKAINCYAINARNSTIWGEHNLLKVYFGKMEAARLRLHFEYLGETDIDQLKAGMNKLVHLLRNNKKFELREEQQGANVEVILEVPSIT